MTRLIENNTNENLKKIVFSKIRRSHNLRHVKMQLSGAKRRLINLKKTLSLSRNLKKIVINSYRSSRSKTTKFSFIINQNNLIRHEKSYPTSHRVNLGKNLRADTLKNQKPNAKWSCEYVQKWLIENGLSDFCTFFRNFNGMDMMRLSQDDVKIICGHVSESSKRLVDLLFNKMYNVKSSIVNESGSNGKQLLVRFSDCNYYNLILLDENKFPYNTNDAFIQKIVKTFEQLSNRKGKIKDFTVYYKLSQSGENLIIKLTNKNINLLLKDSFKYSLQIFGLNANCNNNENQTEVNLLLIKD